MNVTYDAQFYDAWEPWALKLCEGWNLNADIPEIARQIHSNIENIRSDTKEFAVLRDVFNEYFAQGPRGKPPTITQFEAITQVVQFLENNPDWRHFR